MASRNPEQSKHAERFLQVPRIKFHRHRANSLSQTSRLPQIQPRTPYLDMAQRSAVARIKRDKVNAPSVPTSSEPAPRKRRSSNSFDGSLTSTDTGNSLTIDHQYPPSSEGSASSSSLPLSQASSSRVVTPVSFQEVDSDGPKNPVLVPSSLMEDLKRCQEVNLMLLTENAALLAENAQLHAKNFELHASQQASENFSTKLLWALQQYHESQGRVNSDPGNLDSVYYRDLKDEHGNSLVRPEPENSNATPLLGDLADYSYSDEESGEKAEGQARRRTMIARSFDNQRA